MILKCTLSEIELSSFRFAILHVIGASTRIVDLANVLLE
jgi:hypothetical protein